MIVLNSRDRHEKHGVPLFAPPQHASQYTLAKKTDRNTLVTL